MNNFYTLPPGEIFSHHMEKQETDEEDETDADYDGDSPTNFRTRFAKPSEDLSEVVLEDSPDEQGVREEELNADLLNDDALPESETDYDDNDDTPIEEGQRDA